MAYEEGYDYSDILLKALKNLRSSLEYSIDSIESLIDDYNLTGKERLENFSDTFFKDSLKDLVHDWSSIDEPINRQNTEIVKWLTTVQEAYDWIEDHEKYDYKGMY